MRCRHIVWIVGLATGLAWCVGPPELDAQTEASKTPPVLQNTDTPDTRVVTLPGGSAPADVSTPAPAAETASRPNKPDVPVKPALATPAAAPAAVKTPSAGASVKPAVEKPAAVPAKTVGKPAPLPAKVVPPAPRPPAPVGVAVSKPSPLGEPVKPAPTGASAPPEKAKAPATAAPAAVKPALAKAPAATPAPGPVPAKPAAVPPAPGKPTANSPAPAGTPAPAKGAPRAGTADRGDWSGSPDVRPATFTRPTDAVSSEFEKESASFLQKQLGRWGIYDAQALLGKPLRQRVAVDDDEVENGRILAYTDPTGRYKELELDFDKRTGLLRTVYAYPLDLTWQECRRLWGSDATATEANKGRIFYSYQDRRLDVLVAPGGKVISLGLY